MMLSDYFSYKKFVNSLCLVISFGVANKYSFEYIEKALIGSSYFQKALEGDESELYNTNDLLLIKSLYPEIEDPNLSTNFIEFEWISEMLAFILDNTNLRLETILIYFPISKAIEMFPLYHEMDYSESLITFDEIRQRESILNIKMNRLKITNKELQNATGISLSEINLLRNRKRDVRKLNAAQAILLAEKLNINIKTLMEN